MGVKKVYKSTTGIQYGFVVPIKRVGKVMNVSVSLGNDLTLEVLFPDVQEAIERSKNFINGNIVISHELELTEADKAKLESAKKSEEDKKRAIEESNALQGIEEASKVTADEAATQVTDVGGEGETTPDSLSLDSENGGGADEVVQEGHKTEDFTDFPNVTDINGAVEVLRGEPYNVHHMKLRTPTAIQEQAMLNKVTFPNWSVE